MRRFFRNINFRRKRIISSGVITFILIVLLLLLKFFHPTSSRMATGEDWRKDKLKKPIEKLSSSLNDSLPYYEYKKKQDSIRRELFEDLAVGGNGISVLSLGAEEEKKSNGQEKYFLNVFGYFMRDMFDYYTIHGKNFIEYDIWTKEDKNGTKFGELKTAEINLKIEQQSSREWQVGFPLSRSQYYFVRFIVFVLAFIMGILFTCVELFLSLKFLFLIANGKAFTEQGIKCLNIIAAVLIFSAIIQTLIRLGFHLYFKSQVPYPLTFYYYDDIMSGWGLLMAGLIVLLFAKAFRHGYELQEEQDLTV